MPLPPSRHTAKTYLSPSRPRDALQRIFARMQEGESFREIAEAEAISRERLRQIVRAASARQEDQPDHRKMQIARLMPALRLAAYDVENGDAKAIPSLLKLLDRLDPQSIATAAARSARLRSPNSRTGRVAGARRQRKAKPRKIRLRPSQVLENAGNGKAMACGSHAAPPGAPLRGDDSEEIGRATPSAWALFDSFVRSSL